jgi:hypothetical protein
MSAAGWNVDLCACCGFLVSFSDLGGTYGHCARCREERGET